MSDQLPPSEREQQLERILADYLHAVEAGTAPDRASLLEQYPDLAGELRSFFRNRDAIERMAEPIKQQVPEMDTIGPEGAASAAVGSTIRYFGDYELLEEIARGGMGVVWKAKQISLNRLVAVKMILGGSFAGDLTVQRFRREAEAAANLDHPNIVPIHEVGEYQGQQYFSMKLIEGGSLAQRLAADHVESAAKGKRTLSSAHFASGVKLLAVVARAIHFAHQRGILHRDLKPANILLDQDGQPYVSDFGLARRVDGDGGLTQSGAIVGTPSYMAPEQARSEKVLTVAVDVWALGAILYEMLTGGPPFRAATPLDTILQVLDRDPEPPSRLRPGIPRDLETICLKCLHKDPGKRYAAAAELAGDLERYLHGQPILARPVGAVERAWRWCRRNPAVASLTAVAAVCFLAGGAFSIHFGIQANTRAAAVINADKAKDVALAQSDSLRLIARSELERPRDPVLGLLLAVEGGERAATRTLLHNNALLASMFACNERRSFDGTQVLERMCGGRPGVNQHICFRNAELSANGRRLLVLADTTGVPWKDGWVMTHILLVWDVATGALQTVLHVPVLNFETAHLSPDGERIVTTVDSWSNGKRPDGRECFFTPNCVRVWDAGTGKEVALLRGHTGRVFSAEFSSDGQRIVTAALDQTVRVWDAGTGKQLTLIKTDPYPTRWARFTPDGQRVLTFSLSNDGNTAGQGAPDGAIVDPPGANDTDVCEKSISYPAQLEPSSLGGRGDREPRLWDANTGRLIATLGQGPDVFNQTTAAAISPDGSRIATGFWNSEPKMHPTVRKMYMWDGKTGKALDSPASIFEERMTDGVKKLQFSSDGKFLLALYGASWQRPWDKLMWQVVEVFDVETRARPARHIVNVEKRPSNGFPAEMKVRHAELSPDGRRVLLLLGDEEKLRMRHWALPHPNAPRATMEEALDPLIYVWDVVSDTTTRLVGHGHDVTAAHFSADGRHIVSASLDGVAKLWDVQGGQEEVKVLNVGGDGLGLARFSPDGRWIATARGQMPHLPEADPMQRRYPDKKTVRLWDAASGRMAVKLNPLAQVKDEGLRNNLAGDVVGLAFSPDGSRLLTWSQDNKGKMKGKDGKEVPAPFTPVRLWDCASGKEVLALESLTQHPAAAAFSPDGKYLLTVGLSMRFEVGAGAHGGRFEWGTNIEAKDKSQLWDTATGARIGERFGPEDIIAQVLWSPDGQRIYLFSKGGGQIWDALQGKQLAKLEGAPMPRAALSPDGKRLVGYYPYFDRNYLEAVVWDAATGKKTGSLKGHDQEVTAAAFTQDSRQIVTTSADGTVRTWDPASGKQKQVLNNHVGPVRSAAFSADGAWLVTGSDDATARIWRTDTWEEWLTLAGHGGPVVSAEFSSDGAHVVTASRDGTARIWPVDPLPSARQRRPRQLSQEERQRFDVHGEQ